MWFFIWVGGLAVLGGGLGGFGNTLRGAFLGFVMWCVFGFMAFLWGAMSVNDCREYGHPDLADTSNRKTCSDEDIRYYIEHNR